MSAADVVGAASPHQSPPPRRRRWQRPSTPSCRVLVLLTLLVGSGSSSASRGGDDGSRAIRPLSAAELVSEGSPCSPLGSAGGSTELHGHQVRVPCPEEPPLRNHRGGDFHHSGGGSRGRRNERAKQGVPATFRGNSSPIQNHECFRCAPGTVDVGADDKLLHEHSLPPAPAEYGELLRMSEGKRGRRIGGEGDSVAVAGGSPVSAEPAGKAGSIKRGGMGGGGALAAGVAAALLGAVLSGAASAAAAGGEGDDAGEVSPASGLFGLGGGLGGGDGSVFAAAAARDADSGRVFERGARRHGGVGSDVDGAGVGGWRGRSFSPSSAVRSGIIHARREEQAPGAVGSGSKEKKSMAFGRSTDGPGALSPSAKVAAVPGASGAIGYGRNDFFETRNSSESGGSVPSVARGLQVSPTPTTLPEPEDQATVEPTEADTPAADPTPAPVDEILVNPTPSPMTPPAAQPTPGPVDELAPPTPAPTDEPDPTTPAPITPATATDGPEALPVSEPPATAPATDSPEAETSDPSPVPAPQTTTPPTATTLQPSLETPITTSPETGTSPPAPNAPTSISTLAPQPAPTASEPPSLSNPPSTISPSLGSPSSNTSAPPADPSTFSPAGAETPPPSMASSPTATVDGGTTLAPAATATTSPESVPPLAPGTTLPPSNTVQPPAVITAEPETVVLMTSSPELAADTHAPLPAGSTEFPTVSRSPAETATPNPETMEPLAPGATYSPSTTASAVNTAQPETRLPLDPGATYSPNDTLPPAATTEPTPNSNPALAAPTLTPSPAGGTQPPGATPLPVSFSTAEPSPAATWPPQLPGHTLPPDATLSPVTPVVTAPSLSTEHPANAYLPEGGTLGPGETLPPDATLAPLHPAPTATRMPSIATPVEEVMEDTGEATSSVVVVAVAATGAAATVSSVTATTATVAASVGSGAASGGAGALAAVGPAAPVHPIPSVPGGGMGPTAMGGGTTGGTGAAAGGGPGAAAGAGPGPEVISAVAVEPTAAVATTTTTTTTTSTSATTSGTTTVRTGGTATTSSTTGTQPSGGQDQARTAAQSDSGNLSTRSPSATLAMLMIFQIQFLSSLRLLDANISDGFMKMLDSLKVFNLHFEFDLGFGSFCDDEEVAWTENDNGMWVLNTLAVFGFLACLIVCHILLLSYMEASWLSQANAIHRKRLAMMQQSETCSPSRQEALALNVSKKDPKYAKFLDDDNADRDLDDQEARATERFLVRHNTIWAYFPHVELVFLLYAYQGASIAEARMIRSGCFPLVILGGITLFVFPILMLLYVGRIVWSRVKPHDGLVIFEESHAPGAASGGSDGEDARRQRCWCIYMCRGFRDGWKNGGSAFDWANKGAWKSLNDEREDLKSRKFRIGFEPLFRDFTKKGAVYITFLLFKFFALGVVAGLVTDGTVQTAALSAIYLVDIVLLCVLRPFANSFVQWAETVLVTADALTLGLMVWASVLDKDVVADKRKIDTIYVGCMLIQILGIFLFIIPIYVDTFLVLFCQVGMKATQLLKGKRDPKKEKTDIKGSRSETCGIFCILVRENFVGCVKESIHGPRWTGSSQSRPAFERGLSIFENGRMASIKEDAKENAEVPGMFMGRKSSVRSTEFPRRHGPRSDMETGVMLADRSPVPASAAARREEVKGPAPPYYEEMMAHRRSSRGSDESSYSYERPNDLCRGRGGDEFRHREHNGAKAPFYDGLVADYPQQSVGSDESSYSYKGYPGLLPDTANGRGAYNTKHHNRNTSGRGGTWSLTPGSREQASTGARAGIEAEGARSNGNAPPLPPKTYSTVDSERSWDNDVPPGGGDNWLSSAHERGARRGRRRNELQEDGLPRRRSDFSASGMSVGDVDEPGSHPSKGRSRRRNEPREDGLPRRRSGYSSAYGMAVGDVNESDLHSSEASSGDRRRAATPQRQQGEASSGDRRRAATPQRQQQMLHSSQASSGDRRRAGTPQRQQQKLHSSQASSGDRQRAATPQRQQQKLLRPPSGGGTSSFSSGYSDALYPRQSEFSPSSVGDAAKRREFR